MEADNALYEIETSFQWYVRRSRASRLCHQSSEVVLLVVSAAVPIAGILTPGDARLAAILGAVVVALTGLRSVFHWQDNWTRFSLACSSITAQRRLYLLGAPPYEDAATRDEILIRNINVIENIEIKGWTTLRESPSMKPVEQSA